MRAFSDCNPAVIFICLLSCAGIVMFCTNPVVLGLSLAGALALWFVRNGCKFSKYDAFLLILLVVMPLINPLFVHNGITVLLIINDRPITLEALFYGAASAVMIVSVLTWFRSFSQIMTSDRILYVLGAISPKLATLLSMTLRFVPLFGRQATRINNAQRAVGMYKDDNIIDTAKGGVRVFSALTTWALENGIITADSMAARGAGLTRRTSFSVYRFRKSDIVLLFVLILLLGSCVLCLVYGGGEYEFYPSLSPIPADTADVVLYICYAALVFIPAIIEIKEMIKWNCLRSKI